MTASLPGYRILPGMALVSLIFVYWFHFSIMDPHYSFSQQPREKHNWSKLPEALVSSRVSSSDHILPFKDVLWANVGGAQGDSFKMIFKAYCDSRKGESISKECAKAPESMLSHVVTNVFHEKAGRSTERSIKEADAYLYNLRHPVDRMLSWYNDAHPESCTKSQDTKIACGTAKEIQKEPNGSAALFFQGCFPTQDRLSLPFNRSGRAIVGDDCVDLIWETIEGRIDSKSFDHVSYNMNYYYNKTTREFPSKGVLVVRTESLWDDLKDLDLQFEGFGSFEGSRGSSDSELYHKSNDTQSNIDYTQLCCALQDEMHIYRRLLERSLNLNEAAKDATISRAAQRCGFSSWNKMVDQCNTNPEHFGIHQIAHNNPATSMLPASPQLSYNYIQFVHIGKAGGNTLRVLFRVYCESDRHKIDKGCWDSPDSMLSDQMQGFFHSSFRLPHNGPRDKAEAFLYNLRDPVDRMMSWYHYEHPKSCMHNTATRIACHSAMEIKENPRNETALFFQTCFPTQHHFTAAFNSTGTTVLQRTCNNLARRVVEGRAAKRRTEKTVKPIQGFKHISFNMAYYVNQTLSQYPDRDVLVVRTESMWDDLKDLDRKLGGYAIFGQREGYKDSHGSEKYKEKDTLSSEEYGLLCCAIVDELEVYRELLRRAVNLDEEIKQSTLANTASRCGYPSWDDMIRQCTIRQHEFQTSDALPIASIGYSPPILSFKNNITFVHVGQAGMDARSVILKSFCEMNHTDYFSEECPGAPNSTLSDQIKGYVYADDALPTPAAVESSDTYLYNLGHPVEHLLAWYHYESPQTCVEGHENQSAACATAHEIAKHPDGDAAMFFQTCFPTVDVLPSAFRQAGTTALHSECTVMARKVLDGKSGGIGFKHIAHNVRSYAKRTIDKHPEKKVLVIRTESLWDDLKDIDFQLGGSGAFPGMEPADAGLVVSHQRNDTLSTSDYALLCCAVMKELKAYRRLIQLAVNLDEAAKEATILGAAKQCGFESWTEMTNQCSAKTP